MFLDICMEFGWTNLIKLIYKYYDTDEITRTLCRACIHDNFEIVKILINKSDINMYFNIHPCFKTTAFTLAVNYGSIKIIKLLIKHGSDMQLNDCDFVNMSIEKIRFLLKYNIKNNKILARHNSNYIEYAKLIISNFS